MRPRPYAPRASRIDRPLPRDRARPSPPHPAGDHVGGLAVFLSPIAHLWATRPPGRSVRIDGLGPCPIRTGAIPAPIGAPSSTARDLTHRATPPTWPIA